jgi:tetratricopeptide (TPR) repeat protein
VLGRDISVSEQHREQGKSFFEKRDYNASLDSFNKSVNTCPPAMTEQLGIAHTNRSAVLFLLSKHEDCLRDIEAGIKLNPTASKSATVMLRKARCHKRLGEVDEFQCALPLLSHAISLLDVEARGKNINNMNV